MSKPSRRRWTTQGGKRRYTWRPDKITSSEQQWNPAEANADDWVPAVDGTGRVRYWPAATLRSMGVTVPDA